MAVDMEADGFHAYAPQVCLWQLAVLDDPYLLDPLAWEGIPPLGELWWDQAIVKVFHGSDYDMRMIKEVYGKTPVSLEDTKILGELIGAPRLSLGALLEDRLGIVVNKSKKLQRANWAKRPLGDALETYAAGDVRDLLALRDDMFEDLKEKGRESWFEEESQVYESLEPTIPNPATVQHAHRIKGTRGLPPWQLAVLEALWLEREAWGKRRNVATFRLVGNDALFRLATHQKKGGPPQNLDILPRRMKPQQKKRFESALKRGLAVVPTDYPSHNPPKRNKPPKGPPAASEVLREARERFAKKAGIQVATALPGRSLVAIAKARPRSLESLRQVEGVAAWRVEAFGEAILNALASLRN